LLNRHPNLSAKVISLQKLIKKRELLSLKPEEKWAHCHPTTEKRWSTYR
jgi:hypothetical protein